METTGTDGDDINTDPIMHSVNLPWVEKYRPSSLDQLISHTEIINTIQRFINEDRLPHLLLYGPPGTGKTSTIKACAKQLYGKGYKRMVLEVRLVTSGFKLVILDEADAMSNEAQAALRRVIEQYTKHTRFCLICNYVSKISPAVQSRCTRFRFAPLSEDELKSQVQRVIKAENLTVTPEGIDALTRLADGDMRKALNILQVSVFGDLFATSTALAFGDIDARAVYTCTATPQPDDIQSIVSWMLEKPVAEAYKLISEVKTEQGLALQDILKEVHRFMHNIDFPTDCKILLLERFADIEHRLADGATESLQLSDMIATFQRVRELAAHQAER
ncbi:uncharacterized protein MONBRDRAFT_30540 [Monosiga brevicollis MX1]|uniref:AAA+ ATPase domain-containing protein n=1 Tax=Monosiga brevicollis TaxID=81824 RepID=A9VE93_MONBE|nr:uncharacterized protein MONBRDRAFT_30540 [Monosiga brevicollis MX1]EDQ84145.1 predicted protein [Monosiga brevicollis MX1]|eukprot:XP_001751040.1 hypothetical protein [Monosiga brevicollis MX1]